MSGTESTNAYFVRESGSRFRPTHHVGGGWDPNEQHIAPTMGLLAHVAETDFAARRPGHDLRLSRFSCDILGVMPLEPVDVAVQVLRPGRTIELIEARLSHNGRAAAVARLWLTASYDTATLQGTPFPPLPPRSTMQPYAMHEEWPGGFVKSTQIWRESLGTGRVQFWVRSDVALLEDEVVSPSANLLRLLDVANGVASRVPHGEVAFPNLDLTAHLFRQPTSELIGMDTTASFGPDGAGLTQSVLHDEQGPIGTFAQTLTVRPK